VAWILVRSTWAARGLGLLTMLLSLLLLPESSRAAQDPFGLRGKPAAIGDAYLGQIPPGQMPIVFAPDLVSLPGERIATLAFSPDGR